MAILIQITCLMVILGMVFSWPYPLVLERHTPITYVQTSVEEGSVPSSSLFDEMNRMMAGMHERFEHMFGWPTFPMNIYDSDYDLPNDYDDKLNLSDNLLHNENKLHVVVVDDLVDIQKKLDAVQPICTTITELPTTIHHEKIDERNFQLLKQQHVLKN